MLRFIFQGKFFLFLFLISLVGSFFYLTKGFEKEKMLPVVSVRKAFTSDIDEEIIFTGVISPYQEVDIAPKVSGKVTSLAFDVGDRVSEGDELFSLDGESEKSDALNLQENLSTVLKTKESVSLLYSERIKSAEENLLVVKQTNTEATSSRENTKIVSLLTSVAIVATEVDEALGEMLSMRNGVKNYRDVRYYNDLGATYSETKPKAEESLMKYQIAEKEYHDFFNAFVLDKKPNNNDIEKGVLLALKSLESAKIALRDSYSMLLYTLPGNTLSEAQLALYKTNITSLGTTVETKIEMIRLMKSEITQTELNLSVLKKEKDSKLSEIETQAVALSGQISTNQIMVNNSVVYSPFSGIVTAKNKDIGSVVGFGVPLYHLMNDDRVKIEISVPDVYGKSFSVGDEAFIFVDDVEEGISVTITKIYPVLNTVNNRVTLLFEVDNSEHLLRVGAIVRVSLKTSFSKNTVVLPKESLISRYGLSYVFTVKEGVVMRKIVTVGLQTDDSVEIAGGISLSDTVVISGGRYLRNNDRVTVSSSTEYVTQ